uniref:Uncharacterized protein n=1 Tax=Leersia perrieri TaxID=77586 RepID=A0A0D9VQ36_9ORYZ
MGMVVVMMGHIVYLLVSVSVRLIMMSMSIPSTTKKWSMRRFDPPPVIKAIRPHKVINLGGGRMSNLKSVYPIAESMPLNKDCFHPSNHS